MSPNTTDMRLSKLEIEHGNVPDLLVKSLSRPVCRRGGYRGQGTVPRTVPDLFNIADSCVNHSMNALPFGNGTWNPADRVLLADGAWGTELMKLGLEHGECPEEWNIKNQDKVLSVARSYVDAGSDLILTNSFGASSIQLKRHNLEGRAAELNRLAAELSVRAAADAAAEPDWNGRSVVVVGDMGPCGRMYNMGEVGEAELFDSFAEQAAALRDGGAQWLLIETMIDRSEMEVAVRAAAATGLPVIASMTYTRTDDGYRTVMGDTPEACVETAAGAGASVIGANCGNGIDVYVNLARTLRALTDKPLWIKANAGVPEISGRKDGVPHESRGLLRPHTGPAGRRGEHRRRLLRNRSGVHQNRPENHPLTLPGHIDSGSTWRSFCPKPFPAF